MISIIQAFRGLYRLCQCGCKYLIRIISKSGIIRRYKKGHKIRTINQLGFNNNNWKIGRTKRGDYWYIRVNNEYKREHVYFYEQYNKLCMLDWGEVHHIDHNKENNMPWNLEGMMKGAHMILHKIKDRTNIFCSICGSDKTYMRKLKSGSRPLWKTDGKENIICSKCSCKQNYYNNIKTTTL